jgi:hypothetical protein
MRKNSVVLPVSIVSPMDIARLVREIDSIDDYFRQEKIRNGEEVQPNQMSQISKLMDQLVSTNQLNLSQELDRQKIVDELAFMSSSAPILHISFSVDPPGSHIQKIIAWLRTNIDQNALVTIGLQPNIGAGCVVRSTNKLFDMSLREFFADKRQFFIEKIHQSLADPTDQETGQPMAQPQLATNQGVVA